MLAPYPGSHMIDLYRLMMSWFLHMGVSQSDSPASWQPLMMHTDWQPPRRHGIGDLVSPLSRQPCSCPPWKLDRDAPEHHQLDRFIHHPGEDHSEFARFDYSWASVLANQKRVIVHWIKFTGDKLAGL